MTRSWGRSLAASVLAAFVTTSVAGCSNAEKLPTVAEVPTTTNPALAADLLPTPSPLPAAEIVDALRSAVDAGDFCALLGAIDLAEPDASDPSGATDVYESLATATEDARSFLPADLRTDWEVIVDGVTAAADALASHNGDLRDADVERALTSSAMVSATLNIERYQLKQCGPELQSRGI